MGCSMGESLRSQSPQWFGFPSGCVHFRTPGAFEKLLQLSSYSGLLMVRCLLAAAKSGKGEQNI